MNNLNSIIVEGNLTKDPKSTTTPNGRLVCKFTIANNRYYKVGEELQQEVSFFAVETWGRVAKSCADYLSKGRGVRVVGRLKQERWTGQDEKNHERSVLVAEHVEFKPQFVPKEGDSGVQRTVGEDLVSLPDKDDLVIDSFVAESEFEPLEDDFDDGNGGVAAAARPAESAPGAGASGGSESAAEAGSLSGSTADAASGKKRKGVK
jgi:single-strand DNA-binding protein